MTPSRSDDPYLPQKVARAGQYFAYKLLKSYYRVVCHTWFIEHMHNRRPQLLQVQMEHIARVILIFSEAILKAMCVHSQKKWCSGLSECLCWKRRFPSALAPRPSAPIWRLRPSQTRPGCFHYSEELAGCVKEGQLTSVPAPLSSCAATGSGTTLVFMN